MCIARIEADLSVDNVCTVLSVADKHTASALKETCVSYIVVYFHVLHSTEAFKNLPRPLLDLVHAGIAARHYSGGGGGGGGQGVLGLGGGGGSGSGGAGGGGGNERLSGSLQHLSMGRGRAVVDGA